MLILLPPSEGKTAPRRGRPLDLAGLSFASLNPAREEVLDELVSLCTSTRTEDTRKAADVLGLGRTQTDEVLRNASLRRAPTTRADQLYSGVLYDALDLGSLDGSARRRASNRIAVTSALFGLLRPADRIPAYRLSGTVALPGTGPLATYWGARLGPAVLDAAGTGLVVDLRSSTYTAFWRPRPEMARKVVAVRVLHEVAGQRKVVSHFNKATKGRLVRTLLEDSSHPRTVPAFADQLRDLGWHVETGEPGPRGTTVDVVVTDL